MHHFAHGPIILLAQPCLLAAMGDGADANNAVSLDYENGQSTGFGCILLFLHLDLVGENFPSLFLIHFIVYGFPFSSIVKNKTKKQNQKQSKML